MDKDKALLKSHGIVYQLRVQLWKLPSTEEGIQMETTVAMREPKGILNPLLKQTGEITNQDLQAGKVKCKLPYEQCGGIVSNSKSVNQLLISHGITSYICIHIGKQDVAQLTNKLNSKTSNKLSNDKLMHPGTKQYKCPICTSHVELSPGFLTQHLAANHKSRNVLKCSFSGCEFSTWVSHFLKTHLAHVHQQFPFQCSVCPKEYKNHTDLRFHMIIHSAADSKKYVCPRPNCEYASPYPANFKLHLQTHLELKYKCPHCSWRTKYETSIAVHVEKSHGNTIKPKPFKCPYDQCNFAADKLSKLKQHSLVHSDHKPLKCHICNVSTKHRNSIGNHLAVHSGLKPFECNLCGKKMRTSTHLKDHLRRHLGEKPFNVLL